MHIRLNITRIRFNQGRTWVGLCQQGLCHFVNVACWICFSHLDFFWDVKIKDYGIAKGTIMAGDCRLKKSSNTITILKKNSDDVLQLFFLSNIRRSGYSSKFVLFELGRSHASGPGELWIEADDARSADDIYTVLFGYVLCICYYRFILVLTGIIFRNLNMRAIPEQRSKVTFAFKHFAS